MLWTQFAAAGAGTETLIVAVFTMPPLVAVTVTVPLSGGGGKIVIVAAVVAVS